MELDLHPHNFSIYFASSVVQHNRLFLTALGAPTMAGDSLTFDHAYASYQGEIDRLVIETSNNGGN